MKKGLIVLITVLSLLVIAFGGYFVYDNFFNDKESLSKEKDSNPGDETKTTETRNVTETELKEIYKILDKVQGVSLGIKKISNFNAVDNNLKLNIANFNNHEEPFMKKTWEDELKKIFGSNVILSDDSYYCDIKHGEDSEILYNYDETTGKYILNENHVGHGGDGYPMTLNYSLIDSKVVNDTFEISLHKLILINWIGEYGIYGEEIIARNNELFPLTDFIDEDFMTIDEQAVLKHYLENYDAYKLKSATYKYTFKKQNDKFILTGYDYIPVK